jgi:hypothetical protein
VINPGLFFLIILIRARIKRVSLFPIVQGLRSSRARAYQDYQEMLAALSIDIRALIE